MYASKFKQLTFNNSWEDVVFMNQFQFGLHGDMKDLLLNMHDPTILNQAITQAMRCDNQFLEHRQEKCWESSSTLRQFTPPMLQPKHMVSTPNDDPMQINKTQLKPLTK
jgi:hypothetical protein